MLSGYPRDQVLAVLAGVNGTDELKQQIITSFRGPCNEQMSQSSWEQRSSELIFAPKHAANTLSSPFQRASILPGASQQLPQAEPATSAQPELVEKVASAPTPAALAQTAASAHLAGQQCRIAPSPFANAQQPAAIQPFPDQQQPVERMVASAACHEEPKVAGVQQSELPKEGSSEEIKRLEAALAEKQAKVDALSRRLERLRDAARQAHASIDEKEASLRRCLSYQLTSACDRLSDV